MKILLTGATGFIGQKLVRYLLEHTDATLQLAVRKQCDIGISDALNIQRVGVITVGDISLEANWNSALTDCEVVIHAAGRVHVINEEAPDSLHAFREVNVEGTLKLARQAIEAGVRRFIFLSSIKVNGEYTQSGIPFGPDDEVMPEHPYSISKYEAEKGLMDLAEKSQMEVVIIRPPLVYGPGVKGNFLYMIHWLQKKTPLPLGALKNNRRSFVSVDNLVDFIATCVNHPKAANQIFLVSDDDDLSTTLLLRKIRRLLGNPIPLLPVPSWLLNSAAGMIKKRSEMMRLSGSLQVDISKSQKLLNWEPIESVDNALYRTIQDYRKCST